MANLIMMSLNPIISRYVLEFIVQEHVCFFQNRNASKR